MKKETIEFKRPNRRSSGKLKLKKQTIKDLKTDEKTEKIKGGFKCNPSCQAGTCVYISGCQQTK